MAEVGLVLPSPVHSTSRGTIEGKTLRVVNFEFMGELSICDLDHSLGLLVRDRPHICGRLHAVLTRQCHL